LNRIEKTFSNQQPKQRDKVYVHRTALKIPCTANQFIFSTKIPPDGEVIIIEYMPQNLSFVKCSSSAGQKQDAALSPELDRYFPV